MTLLRLVVDQGEDGIHISVKRLVFSILLPLPIVAFSMMSARKTRLLCQAFHRVNLSSRQLIRSAQSMMGKAVEHRTLPRSTNLSLDCWALGEGCFQSNCGCSSGRCDTKAVSLLGDPID
jgi:hypothetical protein